MAESETFELGGDNYSVGALDVRGWAGQCRWAGLDWTGQRQRLHWDNWEVWVWGVGVELY